MVTISTTRSNHFSRLLNQEEALRRYKKSFNLKLKCHQHNKRITYRRWVAVEQSQIFKIRL